MDGKKPEVLTLNPGPEPSYALQADVEAFYESLEWLLVALAIGVLIAYAMNSYRLVLTKVRIVEPTFLSLGDRTSVHEYFALHGSWPKSGDASVLKDSDPQRSIGRYTHDVTLSEFGRLDYTFEGTRGMPNRVLSFRPYQAVEGASSPIFWLCSEAAGARDLFTRAADATTVDETDLPVFCRRTRER